MAESQVITRHETGNGGGGMPPSPLPVVLLCAVVMAMALGPGSLRGQVLLTQEEALELAFPSPTEVERRSAFLDESQLARIRRLAGDDVSVEQSVVTHYVGRRGGRPAGVAYFDVHRVRTMREVIMVLVSPEATVERIEVLRFAEPPEYMASGEWIAQLEGKSLDPDLRLGRDIINMTGATLTSEALTRAARRVLAIHRVVDPFGGAPDAADADGGSDDPGGGHRADDGASGPDGAGDGGDGRGGGVRGGGR